MLDHIITRLAQHYKTFVERFEMRMRETEPSDPLIVEMPPEVTDEMPFRYEKEPAEQAF